VVRLAAKQQTDVAPLGSYITALGPCMCMYIWPAYLIRHGPF